MGKNKLSKFAEMNTIDLVFQYPYGRLREEGFDSFPLKGRWGAVLWHRMPLNSSLSRPTGVN